MAGRSAESAHLSRRCKVSAEPKVGNLDVVWVGLKGSKLDKRVDRMREEKRERRREDAKAQAD